VAKSPNPKAYPTMKEPRGVARVHSWVSQASASRASGKMPSGANAATLAAPETKAMRADRRLEEIIAALP
jgi:hypothetical protein